MRDYKSPDFDAIAALDNNTHNAREVCRRLVENGCHRLVATGSVFECNEGEGESPLRAFSPYGLSKALSWQVLQHYAGEQGLAIGKFVIPNPFGPFEEPRFTAYLIRTWAAGETAGVATPAYVRDNIHVSLLAHAYARFVDTPDASYLAPRGYVETQGEFAQRFATEMRPRLGLDCLLELADQTEFPEPKHRVNTDEVDAEALGWDETGSWDELGAYYRSGLEDSKP